MVGKNSPIIIMVNTTGSVQFVVCRVSSNGSVLENPSSSVDTDIFIIGFQLKFIFVIFRNVIDSSIAIHGLVPLGVWMDLEDQNIVVIFCGFH